MGQAAIFSGSAVKILKSVLSLNGAASVVTGSADPSVTPTSASAGSIYLSSAGSLYVKNDNGNTTNWTLLLDGRVTSGLQLEMLVDDWASETPYGFWTPNIISQAGSTLINSFGGTASLSTADNTILFANAGDSIVTKQQLDAAEFLNNTTGILADIGQADVLVHWKSGSVDPAATYELSRDGGNHFQTVTMTNAGSSTTALTGTLAFADESGDVTFWTDTTLSTTNNLNNTIQAFSQKFTIASGAPWVMRHVSFFFGTVGTPVGNLTIKIVKDSIASPGSPSLLTGDIMGSTRVTAASVGAGGSVNFQIPNTILSPGVYWAILTADATYLASSGANFFQVAIDTTTGPGIGTFNGTTWTVDTSKSLYGSLTGRPLDLRLRVTSSAGSKRLTATAVAYAYQPGSVGATKKTQKFVFNSVIDNTNTFALNFSPDPDLLTCYWIEGGQVFKVPAFNLQGQNAVFPANTFNQGGVSQTITLVFDQNNGGAFDNSDQNAQLLAENHLGSQSGSLDRSAAGRGIFLRRPDGTLREIGIDNNDNIVIYSI